ncbi:hypothetical protein [Winogradskyella undariae]|uniref:hypothetical protein n=1 Tax=Winogradskyella undariae TaxID=1285465 RepID=UPI0015CB7333|nr:hypothetical protein [Winogradskyella undariae]QNK78633.1 hypothetical protein H7F37_06025 [Winogradskyella sp. PAMC22761]
MNNSTEILFYIGQVISGLATFIILIAAIILFIKKKTIATWIILIGYLLVVLTYISGLLISIYAGRKSVETLLIAQGVSNITQSLSYLIFATGLIILVITEFSKKKP